MDGLRLLSNNNKINNICPMMSLKKHWMRLRLKNEIKTKKNYCSVNTKYCFKFTSKVGLKGTVTVYINIYRYVDIRRRLKAYPDSQRYPL